MTRQKGASSQPLSIDERRAEAERYDVRRVHPQLSFGSASDRYAAWIDQIYPRDVWAGQVASRAKRVGAESFDERLLPIASVEDYFLHFGTLELDFTYYAPLLSTTGKPGPGVFTLEQYAEHAPANARFLVKAPQAFVARRVRRSTGGRVQYVDNPEFLDAAGFRTRFLDPLARALGHKLAGIVVEQPYERAAESPEPDAFVHEWDRFFSELPEAPFHLEIRSAHVLSSRYAEWLANRGIGWSFSHWQWLPTLKNQWELAGEHFTSDTREAVVRLMQPRDMTFDESFRLAHPFEKPSPALSATPAARRMVDETVALMYRAIEAGVTLHVVGNNRAWGNTPDLARTLALRFLDFAERRGA